MKRRVPAGYTRLDLPRGDVVVHQRFAEAVALVLAEGRESLHAWARDHAERRELQGRVAAYSAPLPGGGPRVVVRRSHHGGLLAPLLGDLFLPPTRALYELIVSLVLAKAGVATPPVVGYAIYRVGPLLRRVDFLTLELPGKDLGVALSEARSADERSPLLAAAAAVLGGLTQAGAWHPDLNVKNILLVPGDDGALHPAVLDIDRVRFVPPADPNLRDANLQRLVRSVEKGRAMHGAGFDDREIETLRAMLVGHEATQRENRALTIKDLMP